MNTREMAASHTQPEPGLPIAANDNPCSFSGSSGIETQAAATGPRATVGRRTVRRHYDFPSTQAAMAFLAQVEVAGAQGQLPHLDVRGVEVAIRIEAPVALGFMDPAANDEESADSQ